MADWRPHNPTNEPDTCLWCGRKLRHQAVHDLSLFRREGPYKKGATVVGHEEKGGDYQDGYFCGLRCGYQFGVQMAEFGRRIAARGESA